MLYRTQPSRSALPNFAAHMTPLLCAQVADDHGESEGEEEKGEEEEDDDDDDDEGGDGQSADEEDMVRAFIARVSLHAP